MLGLLHAAAPGEAAVGDVDAAGEAAEGPEDAEARQLGGDACVEAPVDVRVYE